jgi:putative phage-type endonuclease
MDLPKHEQRSEEWFTARRERLTASDVATAIGMNPYSPRADLIWKKCGGKDTFKGNEATRYGQKWEDTAIKEYCKRYDDVAYEFGLIEHPFIPFLGGSPDGITAKGVVLEVKCPLKREIIPGVVPSYYLPQVQVVMQCCNLDVCHFIQYKPPPNELLDVTVVHKDDNWFRVYLPPMKFFWDEVVHYRNVGLEYHPVTLKKEAASKLKEKKRAAEDAKEKEESAAVPSKFMFSNEDE